MRSVIRRETFVTPAAFSLADCRQAGEQIIAHARQQAADILRQAEAGGRALAEQLRQQGYQLGLDEGRRAGHEQAHREARAAARQQAQQRIAELSSALTDALAAVNRDKHDVLAAAESGLIRLALAVAERICKLSVGRSTDVAAANVRELLQRVQHHHDLKLHLNPAQLDALRETVADCEARIAGLPHVTLVADADVPPGGCTITTATAQIDATIETQLQRIAEALGASGDHV